MRRRKSKFQSSCRDQSEVMRPKRLQHALADETSTPPAELPSGLIIAKVIRVEGKNLYTVEQPIGGLLLVEMPAKFRSTVWVKRGTFVVIDTQVLIGRENKLGGEISNVVTNEKLWRKQGYW